MKTYVMKDMGYQRTRTSAMLRVTMRDGSKWDVPIQAVADNRDENYADELEDTIGFIRTKQLDVFEITDWAVNNMNWDEVEPYATKVKSPATPVDFQDGWCNGNKTIVGRL